MAHSYRGREYKQVDFNLAEAERESLSGGIHPLYPYGVVRAYMQTDNSRSSRSVSSVGDIAKHVGA